MRFASQAPSRLRAASSSRAALISLLVVTTLGGAAACGGDDDDDSVSTAGKSATAGKNSGGSSNQAGSSNKGGDPSDGGSGTTEPQDSQLCTDLGGPANIDAVVRGDGKTSKTDPFNGFKFEKDGRKGSVLLNVATDPCIGQQFAHLLAADKAAELEHLAECLSLFVQNAAGCAVAPSGAPRRARPSARSSARRSIIRLLSSTSRKAGGRAHYSPALHGPERVRIAGAIGRGVALTRSFAGS